MKRFICYPQSGQGVDAVPALEARGQCGSLYPPLDLHTLGQGQKGGDTKIAKGVTWEDTNVMKFTDDLFALLTFSWRTRSCLNTQPPAAPTCQVPSPYTPFYSSQPVSPTLPSYLHTPWAPPLISQ